MYKFLNAGERFWEGSLREIDDFQRRSPSYLRLFTSGGKEALALNVLGHREGTNVGKSRVSFT